MADSFKKRFWHDESYFFWRYERRLLMPVFEDEFYWINHRRFWNYHILHCHFDEIGRDIQQWIKQMKKVLKSQNRWFEDDVKMLQTLLEEETNYLRFWRRLNSISYDTEFQNKLVRVTDEMRKLKHMWERVYDQLENSFMELHWLKEALLEDINSILMTQAWSFGLFRSRLSPWASVKIERLQKLHKSMIKDCTSVQKRILKNELEVIARKLDLVSPAVDPTRISEMQVKIAEMLKETERLTGIFELGFTALEKTNWRRITYYSDTSGELMMIFMQSFPDLESVKRHSEDVSDLDLLEDSAETSSILECMDYIMVVFVLCAQGLMVLVLIAGRLCGFFCCLGQKDYLQHEDDSTGCDVPSG